MIDKPSSTTEVWVRSVDKPSTKRGEISGLRIGGEGKAVPLLRLLFLQNLPCVVQNRRGGRSDQSSREQP
jgi:hypothetical protein